MNCQCAAPPIRGRGFMLIHVLLAVILLTVFLVVAIRLLSLTLRVTNDATRIEQLQREYDAALARLRADVWASPTVESRRGTIAVLRGAEGAVVTWSIDGDGTLRRTEARASGYPSGEKWPALGEGLTFEADGPFLAVRVPSREGAAGHTVRLASQVQLAREARP